MKHFKRVVNARFKACGLRFDAAIDCDWSLHCYGKEKEKLGVTAIELYCFDKPEWDIRMMYFKAFNDQQEEYLPDEYILHTTIDMEEIRKEARKWVREMRKK